MHQVFLVFGSRIGQVERFLLVEIMMQTKRKGALDADLPKHHAMSKSKSYIKSLAAD